MMWRVLLAVAALLLSEGAIAQIKYPRSTVTLVTHSSPGGGSDVFLRELIKHLGPVMGASFAVENVRGGSGAKAVAQVAQAPPDGAMFYATTPTYIQTTLLSNPAVGYTGLDPLAILFLDPELIYTRADSPWKTLAEVVDYAKTNPGRERGDHAVNCRNRRAHGAFGGKTPDPVRHARQGKETAVTHNS